MSDSNLLDFLYLEVFEYKNQTIWRPTLGIASLVRSEVHKTKTLMLPTASMKVIYLKNRRVVARWPTILNCLCTFESIVSAEANIYFSSKTSTDLIVAHEFECRLRGDFDDVNAVSSPEGFETALCVQQSNARHHSHGVFSGGMDL